MFTLDPTPAQAATNPEENDVATKKTPPLLVTKHETCGCGHCRCEHALGFQFCLKCGIDKLRGASCKRYTWSSASRDLPNNHEPIKTR